MTVLTDLNADYNLKYPQRDILVGRLRPLRW